MAASSAEALAAESLSYFPHDSNAASDEKCQRLIIRCGFEGYGRWWRMCEYLAFNKGHKAAFATKEDKLILARVLGFGGASFGDLMAVEDVEGFIDCLLSVGLLKADENGFLENPRINENALSFGKKRAAGSKGGRPRKNAKKDV